MARPPTDEPYESMDARSRGLVCFSGTAPSEWDVLMNKVIREWTLTEELGRGSMGVVYKATHKFLPGHFAIKVIKPELAQDPEVHSRFLQEAHNATRLKHPNVVDTQVSFEDEGSLYLPMEYLDKAAQQLEPASSGHGPNRGTLKS